MHEKYMERVLQLAKKGEGFVNPNPMVGCVIVKNKEIIAEGYHEKYGGFHAERNALLYANNNNIDVEGSTLYVNLEPCCHYGKTPPCTEIIIKNKIKKVVIGSYDSNPLVAGKGVKKLKNAGIQVETGILDKENKQLNYIFFNYIKTKKPYVNIKYAMTLDGKIATKTFDSKWISNEYSRKDVHLLRHKYSSIMVGINTVLKDNPLLTCRIEGLKNPTRVICDTNLRIPLDCNIVNTSKEILTYIATCSKDKNKIYDLEKKGCVVLPVVLKHNKVDLDKLVSKLGKLGIDSVLIEGGATLNYSALESNIVNKVTVYIGPKILGGKDALTPVEGIGIEKVKEAFNFKLININNYNQDIYLEYEVIKKCLQE